MLGMKLSPDRGNEGRTRRLVRFRATIIYGDAQPLWVDSVEPLCEHCGQRRIEEMHHRLNRSQGGLWIPSHILGLCSLCHHAVTVEPEWARGFGLSVSRGEDPLEAPVQLWYSPHRLLLDDAGGYRVANYAA